jgi:hypothetical protein
VLFFEFVVDLPGDGTTYYYDVSIEDKSDSNILYTLLTGTITVTGDVTTP